MDIPTLAEFLTLAAGLAVIGVALHVTIKAPPPHRNSLMLVVFALPFFAFGTGSKVKIDMWGGKVDVAELNQKIDDAVVQKMVAAKARDEVIRLAKATRKKARDLVAMAKASVGARQAAGGRTVNVSSKEFPPPEDIKAQKKAVSKKSVTIYLTIESGDKAITKKIKKSLDDWIKKTVSTGVIVDTVMFITPNIDNGLPEMWGFPASVTPKEAQVAAPEKK